MELTIIGAIKHFSENAEMYKNDSTSTNPKEEWKEEIKFNEQMAEWLTEVVKLRDRVQVLESKLNSAYDKGYETGYLQAFFDEYKRRDMGGEY